MDLWPLLAAPPALIAIIRAVWVWSRGRLRKPPRDLELTASRAASWARRAGSFFVGRQLRRRWLRAYAVEKYINTAYGKHQYMSIPGRGVTLPIDRCFIPLDLRSGQFVEAGQIMSKTGAVLLIGDPGSGKSALLSRFVRTTCRAARDDRDRARLPVYLPLDQVAPLLTTDALTGMSPAGAFELLLKWFKEYELTALRLFESDDLLSMYAADPKHGVCILLDGLDELGTDFVSHVESYIISLTQYLATAEGRNLVVVATRHQGLEFTPRLTSGSVRNLLTVELKPFTSAAIYSFLLRWPYRAGVNAPAEARRIFSQLRLNPTLFDACSNPLALALYVGHYLRHRDDGGDASGAPETRAGFFAQVVDHLLVSRRVDRLRAKMPNRAFKLARLKFFVDVAWSHVQSREPFNNIAHDIMLRHATEIARDGQSLEEAVSEVARDSGLIVRAKNEGWRFMHQSFLDYFIACSLADTSTKAKREQLFRLIDKDPMHYLEPFFLACGLMAARGTPYLQTVLDALGRSVFISHHYPRAALEAQSYFSPGFVSTIRGNVRQWRTDRANHELLRNLIAVLADYENACTDLGRSPEVSIRSLLWDEPIARNVSVLEIAQLDVGIAMTLVDTEPSKLLLSSAVDEAIVALYEPELVDKLSDNDIIESPRLAAIVAEAALRSSLVSGHLAPEPQKDLKFALQPLKNDTAWADSWVVRGSRYGRVLEVALPYIEGASTEVRASFPHLVILAAAKPIRRLRNELLLSDGRLTALIFSIVGLAGVGLTVTNLPSLLVTTAVAVVALATLYGFRWAVHRGLLTLSSLNALNLQPVDREFAPQRNSRIRLVAGTRQELRLIRFRRPTGADGPIWAVYDRRMRFAWKRFSPSLGDRRLSRLGCAAVQQMWTEEVRQLVGGS